MAFRHCHRQRLRPDRAGVAFRQVECADQKPHVDPVRVQMGQHLAGRSFDHLDCNSGMLGVEAHQQAVKKAAGDQPMNADAQPSTFPCRRNGGGLHGMVDEIDTRFHQFHKNTPGFRQPDASCMALEQENTKVILQRLHAGADAGLCNAERIGGVTLVEIFGDSESVN